MLHNPRYFFPVLLLALLCLPSCSESPEDKVQRYFTSATEYIAKGDTKAAIIELRNVIQLDPKNAAARYELGKLYLKSGNHQSAFNELQRAFTLDQHNLDAGIKVAEFYLMAKNKEESRNWLDKVLQTDPNYPDGLALLANLEIIQGNFDAAQVALDKVDDNIAQTDRFYNIQGRLYAAREQYEASEEMFVRALEAGPDKISNYRTLLLFYQNRGLPEKAAEVVARMEKSFPDDIQAQLVKASYYRSIKDQPQAEEALRKIIEIKPQEEKYRLMLAAFFKQTEQKEKHTEALNQAREDFPESQDIKAALADHKFSLKQLEEAETLMNEVLAVNGEHRTGTLVKAKLLYAKGKFRDAIELLNKLIQNYPKWGEPRHVLALSHMRLGEVELAQVANEAALRLSPGNSKYHTIQAQIMLIQGDGRNGGQEATIALKLNPRNYMAAKLLTRALLQEKRFDDAIKLISDIKKQVPDDPQLNANLGLAYLGTNNTDEAKKIFTELLAKIPDNSKALAMVASLTAKGDLKVAIAIVKEQISKVPDSFGHYILLGNLLLKDKQDSEALSAFSKAQELSPKNPQPYIIRGRVMHSMGKAQEAISEFSKLLQNTPNSIPGLLGLASVYESQQKSARAKELYLKVLELEPSQPAAANNLAYILIQEPDGDLGEALRLGMLAKQALPDDPRIADTLGMIHLRREAYGLAISQFSLALSERPGDPTINYHMALAQLKNEDEEQATLFLERSLSSEETFSDREKAESLLAQLNNS